MREAVFKKKNLSLYNIIDGPGTFMVKVSSRVGQKQLIEDGSKSRYLVNLRVATVEQLESCLNLLSTEDEISFSEVRHCFITGVIWENDVNDLLELPTKGETVIATFDYVDEIIRCVSITLIPRRRLQQFDPEAYRKSKDLLKTLFK